MDDRSEDIFDLDSGPVLPTRHPQPVTRFFDQDQMDLLAQLDAKIPRLDSQAYYEEQVQDFQAKLTDFLTTRKAALLEKIRAEKAFSDALAGELKTAVTEFKQSYR